ncbi:hypothetical protein HDU76_009643 [Blyttiomyces sp. JEL0837]|nr:hypothetical protein HDU76_009643 [Blyttiomyces sp. JEL0837]
MEMEDDSNLVTATITAAESAPVTKASERISNNEMSDVENDDSNDDDEGEEGQPNQHSTNPDDSTTTTKKKKNRRRRKKKSSTTTAEGDAINPNPTPRPKKSAPVWIDPVTFPERKVIPAGWNGVTINLDEEDKEKSAADNSSLNSNEKDRLSGGNGARAGAAVSSSSNTSTGVGGNSNVKGLQTAWGWEEANEKRLLQEAIHREEMLRWRNQQQQQQQQHQQSQPDATQGVTPENVNDGNNVSSIPKVQSTGWPTSNTTSNTASGWTSMATTSNTSTRPPVPPTAKVASGWDAPVQGIHILQSGMMDQWMDEENDEGEIIGDAVNAARSGLRGVRVRPVINSAQIEELD